MLQNNEDIFTMIWTEFIDIFMWHVPWLNVVTRNSILLTITMIEISPDVLGETRSMAKLS